jgi:hypothetical protein
VKVEYSDDFGVTRYFEIDMDKLKDNFMEINHEEYDLDSIKSFLDTTLFGINPFDLYVLKQYIVNKGIKRVCELGCGSSSYFMDKLGVHRESFAYEDVSRCGVKFVECDIYESADMILDSCKKSDLLFIDSQHNTKTAEFYSKHILKYTNLPVFIHDWYLPDELKYPEQEYWIENLLYKTYDLFVLTRLMSIDECECTNIKPCSAILHKLPVYGRLKN